MQTTYQAIKAIPAKGFDWVGFNEALRAKVVAVNAAMPHTLAEWDAAKGMRAVRTAAMEMAAFYVDKVSKRQLNIAPSDESNAWDSFEGGHNDVWNDEAAANQATKEVINIIRSYIK